MVTTRDLLALHGQIQQTVLLSQGEILLSSFHQISKPLLWNFLINSLCGKHFQQTKSGLRRTVYNGVFCTVRI